MIIILNVIEKIIWGISSIFLLGTGLFYSIKLKFIQFKFFSLFKGFKNNRNYKVSPFKSLMLTLGGKIGVGTIAGTALSIYIGGPGTIFWMWISTFLVSINAYVESYLSLRFKKNISGPYLYIKNGLKNDFLAVIYAILIIIVYIFGFNSIQSNTITKMFDIPFYLTAIILSILVIFSIKNVNKLMNISAVLVPIMGIIYIVLAIVIISNNYLKVIDILSLIIRDAFNSKDIWHFFSTMIIGIQRGIFSNEAGIGSGAISSASTTSNDASGQGKLQILGTYFTSLVLCTLTALIILLSNSCTMQFTNFNGIELAQYAFNYHFGFAGNTILSILIFLFAFSTILTSYYYGNSALTFLLEGNNKYIRFLKIITVGSVFLGTFINSFLLWNLCDILIGVLAIINSIAILKLRHDVN